MHMLWGGREVGLSLPWTVVRRKMEMNANKRWDNCDMNIFDNCECCGVCVCTRIKCFLDVDFGSNLEEYVAATT